MLRRWAWVLKFKTKPGGKGQHGVYDLTEDDVRTIAKAKRASEYRHSEIKSATMKRVQEEYRAIRIERSNETTRRNKSYMTAVRAAAALRRRIREWRDRHDSVTEFQLPNLGGVHPWRADERASWAEHESKKGQ
jgi:hypothetical protein